jgi:hypothetical protein
MCAKKRTFAEWFLLPFKVYLIMAPIGLFLWHETTFSNRVSGAFGEAISRIALGYLFCIIVFGSAAAACFITRRRQFVAENLLLAGIAATIVCFLAIWNAA